MSVREAGEAECLAAHSFVLAGSVSGAVDFYDEAEMKAVYHGEMLDLVKELAGANKVFTNGHITRSEAVSAAGVRSPHDSPILSLQFYFLSDWRLKADRWVFFRSGRPATTSFTTISLRHSAPPSSPASTS